MILIGTTHVFAEESDWHLGKNLHLGDYYQYRGCDFDDWNYCPPFNFLLWVIDETEDSWILQTKLEKKGEVFNQSFSIDKDTTRIIQHSEVVQHHPSESTYNSSFVQPLVSHINNDFSPISTPITLQTIDSHLSHKVLSPEIISTTAGVFNATLITFDGLEGETWIDEELPFPIKTKGFVGMQLAENKICSEFSFSDKRIGTIDCKSIVLDLVDYHYNNDKDLNRYISSPLDQYKRGISSFEIICKSNLELILKSSNDAPACVTHATMLKLVERGWQYIDTMELTD